MDLLRENYALSNYAYGCPWMIIEFKEGGLDVGERRVERMMKINGITWFALAVTRSRPIADTLWVFNMAVRLFDPAPCYIFRSDRDS